MNTSSAIHPTSNRAGKSRASDVGIRARMAAFQTTTSAAAPAAASGSHIYVQVDPRPNEIREALNAHQMASLTTPVPKPQVRGRPTQTDLLHGNMYVNWVRKGIVARIPYMNRKEVPIEQKAQYDAMFDVLWGHVFEMDPLLPVYAGWMTEDTVRQLIIASTVVKHQKSTMPLSNPQYILDLPTIEMMIHAVQSIQQAIVSAQQALQRPSDLGTRAHNAVQAEPTAADQELQNVA